MSFQYTLEYDLPQHIVDTIGAAIDARHTNKDEYRRLMTTLLHNPAVDNDTKKHIETELAIRLAQEAQRWAQDRPLATSWRGFSLGAALVTSKWIYDAYNMKPLKDTASEERGAPKVRICAEQQAVVYANDQDDVDFRLIVLAGVHHNDGYKEMPKPCLACLRYFTAVPGHRDIEIILIHSATGEKQLYTLGEIIDSAPLEKIECTCCTPSDQMTTIEKWRNFILPQRMRKVPDLQKK